MFKNSVYTSSKTQLIILTDISLLMMSGEDFFLCYEI